MSTVSHSRGLVKVKKSSLDRHKQRQKIMETLFAAGVSLEEVARSVKLSVPTVKKRLSTPEALIRIEEINKQICDRAVSEAANLAEAFDVEASEAFKTLQRLNRGLTDDIANPVPHAVSLQAAAQILDRAPRAPRKLGESGGRHLHLHLPEKHFEAAQQALLDIGMGEDPESEA